MTFRLRAVLWRLAAEGFGNVVDRAETADGRAALAGAPRLVDALTKDFERWSYNTAVAACMAYVNQLYHYVQSEAGARRETLDAGIDRLLLVLAPMTPHITAELWSRRHDTDLHRQSWPEAEPALLVDDQVTVLVHQWQAAGHADGPPLDRRGGGGQAGVRAGFGARRGGRPRRAALDQPAAGADQSGGVRQWAGGFGRLPVAASHWLESRLGRTWILRPWMSGGRGAVSLHVHPVG